MLINTRDFGEINIDQDSIVTFSQPVYGFEHLTKYIFLFNEGMGQFAWLQSVEDSSVCFLLINPQAVVADYNPKIHKEVTEMVGSEQPMLWLIVVVADQLKNSTVNLKSPVVVNTEKRRAAQVILEEDLPIRFPLIPNEEEER